MKVLVAEDEAGAAIAMGRFLELKGHEVAIAADGRAALGEAERAMPDALIADWRLGHEMDGVELARQLRRRRPELMVILISAYSTRSLQDAAQDLPQVQVLSKPLQLLELARLLDAGHGD